MNKADVKNLLHTIWHHLWILFLGLIHTIHSTLVVVLFAVSIYGFCTIPMENGYAAIAYFIVSCLSLVVVIANVYLIGLSRKFKSKKKGGK